MSDALGARYYAAYKGFKSSSEQHLSIRSYFSEDYFLVNFFLVATFVFRLGKA
jgi:hypothetical protein